MILHAGQQDSNVLGIEFVKFEFELAYCENGGGRKSLDLHEDVDGFRLVYSSPSEPEAYEIDRGWDPFRNKMNFKMKGTDFYGKPVDVDCQEYKDTRTDIDYVGNYLP
jgi:hypothetical protein